MEQEKLVELVYGDTDSLYISYENLLNTIEGIENWTDRQKSEFLARLNTEFLNDHNKEVMQEHYGARHCRSMVQEFELETINKSGVWLDVKKRYAQILLWKDGKFYDEDSLPLKVKGLEIIKASYPKIARSSLKVLTRTLLENSGPSLIHVLNKELQTLKANYLTAPLEDICPTSSVNNYDKYIISDSSPDRLVVASGCPFVVRATAYYNSFINSRGYKDALSYGGKHRWYVVKKPHFSKNGQDIYFAYEPGLCPSWAQKEAPIDRDAMFNRMVVEPFNRILEPIGMPLLNGSGSIQLSLFDEIF